VSASLYVSNLHVDVTEAELLDLFGAVGVCRSVRIVKRHDTGESRGFAFVEMATSVEAQTAARRLAARVLNGQALRLDVIIERNRRRPRKVGSVGRIEDAL